MSKTSEKSIEINVLHKLVDCLEKKFNSQITVLAPTQRQERYWGFDDELYGLPNGRIIVLQFKRPYYGLSTRSVDFRVSVSQMCTLHDNIPWHNCAFYIFSPFPEELELVQRYGALLDRSMAIDVHAIWNQDLFRTRKIITVRLNGSGWKIVNLVSDLANVFPASRFCDKHDSEEIGVKQDVFFKKLKMNKKNFKYMKKIYVLHISE